MIIKCRICENSAVLTIWGGSVCSTCGSISVTELPTREDLNLYYKMYNIDYHGGGRKENAGDRQDRYARFYIKPLIKAKVGGKLLDIGSSTNPFPNLAVQNGYQVTVVDYLKPACLDDSIRFIQGSINDDQVIRELSEEKFDFVTAFAVIEHCTDPVEMLTNMVELCKDNGLIIITTPLVNSFSEKYALGKTPWFYPPEHIHLLSIIGMKNVLNKLNCQLVSFSKYELNWFRWILRYGFAYYEGCKGYFMRKVFNRYWIEARNTKTSQVQEMAIYIIQK